MKKRLIGLVFGLVCLLTPSCAIKKDSLSYDIKNDPVAIMVQKEYEELERESQKPGAISMGVRIRGND